MRWDVQLAVSDEWLAGQAQHNKPSAIGVRMAIQNLLDHVKRIV